MVTNNFTYLLVGYKLFLDLLVHKYNFQGNRHHLYKTMKIKSVKNSNNWHQTPKKEL